MSVSAPVVLPIDLTPSQVRPVAYRIVSKKHGLNLKSSALDVLANFLGRRFGGEWRGPGAEKCLDELAKLWKDEDRGLFVEGESLRELIKEWSSAQASTISSRDAPPALQKATRQTSLMPDYFDWKQYFQVVSAQNQPRFVYNSTNRHYELGSAPQAVAPPESLTELFKTRFYELYDRIYRNDLFQTPAFASKAREGYALTPIKNLVGREKGTEFFLFGLLTLVDSGWILSDVTSRIALEFTEHSIFAPDHYYTSGSFVLCHGVYMGSYFQVGTLGPPPAERRKSTQEALGYIDFYGSHRRIERADPSLLNIMAEKEAEYSDHRFVFLGGDIHLDQQHVIDSLRRVIAHLDGDPPTCLILSGSFTGARFSPHIGMDAPGGSASYRDAMNAFAEILQGAPRLTSSTKIVILPGDRDPWHAAASKPVWPLRPLPSVFTGRVSRTAPQIEWASNPCRILYLSQEIVVARDDFGARMRRNSISSSQTSVPGDASAAEARKVAATLLDQCHLSPFSLTARPVSWDYDHTLSLAQWPSSLVVVDTSTPQFKLVYEDVIVMNPGTFMVGAKAQWLEFWPASGRCDFNSL